MAWESRKGTNQTYYTQSKRVDGQIVRKYLGNGPKAREAARRCDQIRWLRQFERDHQTKHKLWLAECVRACDEIYELVDVLYRAEMAAAGYHYHRGEWRKRRHWQEEPVATEPRAKKQVPRPAEPVQPYTRQLRRRQMPLRRTLDCRYPLVRGTVSRPRIVDRSNDRHRRAKRAFVRGWSRRRQAPTEGQSRRPTGPHIERSAEIGMAQRPRPPPRHCG